MCDKEKKKKRALSNMLCVMKLHVHVCERSYRTHSCMLMAATACTQAVFMVWKARSLS